MSERVNRTVTLKKIYVHPSMGRNFEQLLAAAYAAKSHARDRRMKLSEDDKQYQILNTLEESNNILTGSIFSFTEDANQNAVEIKSMAKSYPIKVFAPPRTSGRRLEFVEGLIYLAAKGNYMAIMSHQHVSPTMIESYLGWLLSSHVGHTVSVLLKDPARPELRNYNMQNAKRIVLHNGIRVAPREQTQEDGNPIRYRADGFGWDAIKKVAAAFGGVPPDLEDLDDEHALDRLKIEVVISTRRIKAIHGARGDAMEVVANAFRDMDNPPVTFEFKDGRKITLSDYRVSCRVSIASKNKIPDEGQAKSMLRGWLKEQILTLNLARV